MSSKEHQTLLPRIPLHSHCEATASGLATRIALLLDAYMSQLHDGDFGSLRCFSELLQTSLSKAVHIRQPGCVPVFAIHQFHESWGRRKYSSHSTEQLVNIV
jgi:hypothetical protein